MHYVGSKLQKVEIYNTGNELVTQAMYIAIAMMFSNFIGKTFATINLAIQGVSAEEEEPEMLHFGNYECECVSAFHMALQNTAHMTPALVVQGICESLTRMWWQLHERIRGGTLGGMSRAVLL